MTHIPFKNNYIQVSLSANSASVTDNGGERCTFDTISFKGNGHLSLSSGKVGLLAGRTYLVSASIRCDTGESLQLYDFTNGIGISPFSNIAENVNSDGHIECVITPTGDIQVGVSTNNSSTYQIGSADFPSMFVREL